MKNFKRRCGLSFFLVQVCLALSIPTFSAEPASPWKSSLREDVDFVLGKKGEAAEATVDSVIYHSNNEVKLTFLGLIWVYQVFLSSQDGDHCGFTPTCSHFGKEALKKYGFVEGTLMTSDRVQRCNGFGRDHYPIDPTTEQAIDPVSVNALWH